MRNYLIMIIIFPLFAISQPAVDGYMKGKSNLDLSFGATFESFGKYYERAGELTPISRTSIAASLYAAEGITEWLDAQINLPYIYTAQNFSNFQDLAIYLKASLFNIQMNEERSLRILAAAGTSFPMTNYETEGLNAIGQQATAFDGRLILQCTRSSGFFIMVQGGYIYRLDPVPSGIPAAIKVGMAKSNYYFDVWYDQQYSSEGNDYADYNGLTNPISFRTFGVSYGKLGASFYKPISPKSGLSFGGFYVLWGRNVGQAFGASVSFVHRFNFSGS